MTARPVLHAPRSRFPFPSGTGRAAALALALAALPSAADAQTSAGALVRRLEIAVGAGVFGGGTLGAADATLRANSLAPEPFRLFTTETRMAWAPVLEARAGFALTEQYGIEGGVSFGRPDLRTSVTDDVEGAPPLVVTERIEQYLVDAGLFVTLEALRMGPLLPVVSGGAGYLRQLHEGRTVVEEGRFFHAAFGVRYWLSSGGQGLVKGSGVRADARLYVIDGGITLEDGARTQAGVSGRFFMVF